MYKKNLLVGIFIMILPLTRAYANNTQYDVVVKFNDTLNIKFSWNNERYVVGGVSKPVALIGVYSKITSTKDTIKDIYNSISYLNFPAVDTIDFREHSYKGFKILNLDSEFYQNDEQFWRQYNLPWLESLTQNKTTIYVLSSINTDQLKYQFIKISENTAVVFKYSDLTYQLMRTGFGKEIEYMEDKVRKGVYRWDETHGAFLPVN